MVENERNYFAGEMGKSTGRAKFSRAANTNGTFVVDGVVGDTSVANTAIYTAADHDPRARQSNCRSCLPEQRVAGRISRLHFDDENSNRVRRIAIGTNTAAPT